MLQLNQDLDQDDARSFRHQVGSPIANSPPGSSFEIFNIHYVIGVFIALNDQFHHYVPSAIVIFLMECS